MVWFACAKYAEHIRLQICVLCWKSSNYLALFGFALLQLTLTSLLCCSAFSATVRCGLLLFVAVSSCFLLFVAVCLFEFFGVS